MKNSCLGKFKRVWVAGHKGMVGSGLVNKLEGMNLDVLKIDKNQLDLRVQSRVDSWFKKINLILFFWLLQKLEEY